VIIDLKEIIIAIKIGEKSPKREGIKNG